MAVLPLGKQWSAAAGSLEFLAWPFGEALWVVTGDWGQLVGICMKNNRETWAKAVGLGMGDRPQGL